MYVVTKNRSDIPKEVDELVDTNMPVGASRRVLHKYKHDGSVCSLGKDSAMNIIHQADCWKWKCFRCKEAGKLLKSRMTVNQIQNAMAKLDKAVEKQNLKPAEPVTLPDDCVPVFSTQSSSAAKGWLLQYGIDTWEAEKYDIQWSEKSKRIIFPIYKENKLVAWQGRCIAPMSKEDRRKFVRPKYLLRRPPDMDRVFFSLVSPTSKFMIMVEDIISAIKVYEATGHTVIALLTSTISPKDIYKRENYDYIFWLDPDMNKEALKLSKKFNMLGLLATCIYTKYDPKAYSEDLIREKIETYTDLSWWK